MTKTGIQISSVKAYMQDEASLRASLLKFHQIGYRYAQMQWMSPDIAPAVVADAMREAELVSLGTQDYYEVVMQKRDYYYDLCKLTGAKYLCVSGIPKDKCSVEGILQMCKEINALSDDLKKDGMVVTFHPRWQEYELFGGKSGVDILLENTDPSFQITLDFNHVIRSGIDGVALLKKLKGRCDIVHFKDSKTADKAGSPLVPVGQGCVNWQPIFDACNETGVLYGLAEQESWEKDAFESLADCYRFIEAGLNR